CFFKKSLQSISSIPHADVDGPADNLAKVYRRISCDGPAPLPKLSVRNVVNSRTERDATKQSRSCFHPNLRQRLLQLSVQDLTQRADIRCAIPFVYSALALSS